MNTSSTCFIFQVSSLSYVHQPVAVAQPVAQHYAVAQPVVHAAPAAVIAKPAATSYASFQQVHVGLDRIA